MARLRRIIAPFVNLRVLFDRPEDELEWFPQNLDRHPLPTS